MKQVPIVTYKMTVNVTGEKVNPLAASIFVSGTKFYTTTGSSVTWNTDNDDMIAENYEAHMYYAGLGEISNISPVTLDEKNQIGVINIVMSESSPYTLTFNVIDKETGVPIDLSITNIYINKRRNYQNKQEKQPQKKRRYCLSELSDGDGGDLFIYDKRSMLPRSDKK